jgi:hypothetical protein
MRRFQARHGNGRFTPNTPENTLGLHMGIHERKANGEWCGAFNPSPVGEQRPTHCHICGESLIQHDTRREKGSR